MNLYQLDFDNQFKRLNVSFKSKLNPFRESYIAHFKSLDDMIKVIDYLQNKFKYTFVLDTVQKSIKIRFKKLDMYKSDMY